MSKYVAPSIVLQSFNCPHCGALAAQTWFRVYSRNEDNNSPHILQPSDYKQISDNAKTNGYDLSPDFLTFFKKKSEGELFFEKESDSVYCPWRAENLHISECYSCNHVSLWLHDKLLYPPEPEAEEANQDMPEDIKQDYQEARVVFKYSPKASAALLRLCVEKLCMYLNAEGDNINEMIGYLVQNGLNSRLQKALDAVRVIGNEAVHPGQINLNDNKDIARALFKLVNQIVQELISDKKEIDEIYDLLPDSKKKGIEARDKKKAS